MPVGKDHFQLFALDVLTGPDRADDWRLPIGEAGSVAVGDPAIVR